MTLPVQILCHDQLGSGPAGERGFCCVTCWSKAGSGLVLVALCWLKVNSRPPGSQGLGVHALYILASKEALSQQPDL